MGEPQLVDTTYIDNVVAAHLAASERLAPGAACAGKANFLSQGEPAPGPWFVNDLLAAAGLRPVDRTLPLWVARAAAAGIETVWTMLRLTREPPQTRFMVSQLATAHWYDISAARRDLDYRPAVSYEQGIAWLAEWLDQNPGHLGPPTVGARGEQ